MDGTPELAGLQREWYYKTKCGNEDFFSLTVSTMPLTQFAEILTEKYRRTHAHTKLPYFLAKYDTRSSFQRLFRAFQSPLNSLRNKQNSVQHL